MPCPHLPTSPKIPVRP
eukprot:CCRYP_015443-RB/>CCRYP_015443-RB protein AED:0.50 eAED:1.00 QI:0/-1/0/1/-1/0/1/0/16